MAYTYDVTNNNGKVRFLLQDNTNTTARPSLLTDEEITYALSVEANVFMAAALCADSLAGRFRGMSNKRVGNLSITYDPKAWEGVAARLRARSGHQLLSAGGITISDRDAIWDNTDLIRPTFFGNVLQDPNETPTTRTATVNLEEFLP